LLLRAALRARASSEHGGAADVRFEAVVLVWARAARWAGLKQKKMRVARSLRSLEALCCCIAAYRTQEIRDLSPEHLLHSANHQRLG
jgi:hypothetical protein